MYVSEHTVQSVQNTLLSKMNSDSGKDGVSTNPPSS